MHNVIMTVSVDKRTDTAPTIQEILTEHGCDIRTRLGLHAEGCSERGIIVLHLYADDGRVGHLHSSLETLPGVHVNEISVD